MSHSNSPRVSPNSAATTALSQAGDEQAQPTAAHTDTDTDTAQTASSSSSSPAALVTQAQHWLQSARLPASFQRVPEPLKRLATQTGQSWRQLTTTQKVVGGAVLAVGGWLLLRPGKSTRRRGANPTGTLHELLLFVNDRVEGYQRAARESQDGDLRNYYEDLAGQSKQFATRLNGYLRVQQSDPETGTTL